MCALCNSVRYSSSLQQYIVPCTLLAKFDVVILAVASLPWHANLANKLLKHRGFCTIVLHFIGNLVICFLSIVYSALGFSFVDIQSFEHNEFVMNE